MPLAPDPLPDDIAALKRLFLAQTTELAAAQAELAAAKNGFLVTQLMIEKLKAQIAKLRCAPIYDSTTLLGYMVTPPFHTTTKMVFNPFFLQLPTACLILFSERNASLSLLQLTYSILAFSAPSHMPCDIPSSINISVCESSPKWNNQKIR